MSILIPLASIDPNPWQPRTRFNDDALIELATDIERNGLLQPSLGRLVEPDGAGGWKLHGEARTGLAVNADFVARLLASGARVQLAAGERRFRAYKILQAKGAESGAYVADLFARPVGFDALPLQLAPFDDVRMATLAWSENESRQDTTPVERARFLQRLTQPVEAGGFGWTQQRAADEVGMDRASVTNLLRLLRLPADALEALDAGEISQQQARVIVTATDQLTDDDFALFAAETYRPNWVPPSADELVAGLVTSAREGQSADALRHRVTQLASRAKDRRDDKQRRDEHAAKSRAKTEAEIAKRGLDVEIEALPVLGDMRWDTYERIRSGAPAGCTKNCPCRTLARDSDGSLVQICTSPKRFKKLQNAKAKEDREPAKVAITDYLTRFRTELVGDDGGVVWTPGVTLLLAERMKYSTSVKETRAVAAAMLEAGTVTAEQAEVLGNFAGGTWDARDGCDELLATLPAAVVLRFFVEALVRKNLAHLVESRRTSHKLVDALFAAAPAPDVSADTPTAPAREEGDWERATRLDLQEGVDPAVNLADVEARFQEARAHYRALREADAPEEFATARARLADIGRALALSRAAMPPAPEVSADTSAATEDADRTLYESGPDDDITKHPVTTAAEAPAALTPEQRIEALRAGDVDVLRDMSDGTLRKAGQESFLRDWPAHICEAIRTEEARRAAAWDAPVAEAPADDTEPCEGCGMIHVCECDDIEADRQAEADALVAAVAFEGVATVKVFTATGPIELGVDRFFSSHGHGWAVVPSLAPHGASEIRWNAVLVETGLGLTLAELTPSAAEKAALARIAAQGQVAIDAAVEASRRLQGVLNPIRAEQHAGDGSTAASEIAPEVADHA